MSDTDKPIYKRGGRYIGIKGVRERYDVSTTTIYNWIRDRGFPTAYYPSGAHTQRRWLIVELDAWDRDCLKKAA